MRDAFLFYLTNSHNIFQGVLNQPISIPVGTVVTNLTGYNYGGGDDGGTNELIRAAYWVKVLNTNIFMISSEMIFDKLVEKYHLSDSW
jgi:hypothetical protein